MGLRDAMGAPGTAAEVTRDMRPNAPTRNTVVTALGVLMMTSCAPQQMGLSRETSATASTNTYPEIVKAHIRNYWGYPCISNADTNTCDYKDATVVVQFGVRKDGTLGYVKILKSSGYTTYDDHAVDTVKRAAPFPPIPDSFSLTGVPIDATMRYEVKQERPK